MKISKCPAEPVSIGIGTGSASGVSAGWERGFQMLVKVVTFLGKKTGGADMLVDRVKCHGGRR